MAQHDFFRILSILIIFLLNISTAQMPEQTLSNEQNTNDVQTVKHCSKCQYWEQREDAKFCPQCGNVLQYTQAIVIVRCQHENRTLENGDKFCPFCGKPVKIIYQEVPGLPKNQIPIAKSSDVKSENNLNDKYVYQKNQTASKKATWITNAPECKIFENKIIVEGLPHTSEQRQVTRFLFTSSASLATIENYYKGQIHKYYGSQAPIQVIRMQSPLCKTPILQMKFLTPQKTMSLEIMYFTYSDLIGTVENKKKLIEEKIQAELKPSKDLQREIQRLQELKENKSSPEIDMKIRELEQRSLIASNSNTYWQFYSQEQMLAKNTNILMICIITKK